MKLGKKRDITETSKMLKISMKPTFHSLVVSDIINETEDTVSIAFVVPSEYSISLRLNSFK